VSYLFTEAITIEFLPVYTRVSDRLVRSVVNAFKALCAVFYIAVLYWPTVLFFVHALTFLVVLSVTQWGTRAGHVGLTVVNALCSIRVKCYS